MSARFELAVADPAYPPLLRQVHRPPRRLLGIGDPALLVPGLAVIGARKATPYGLRCVAMLAGAAAEAGVTIISGAAIGCDLAAHQAALAAGAPTIAVLGCGADVDYPQRAAATLSQIRSGRGAVVSELEWGTGVRPGHFPARNRIIAGLAAALLVVEAALPSGTFSTADSALDAGRDVLAVPGGILYPGSAGSNRLVRQGATPITCVEDLVDALAACGLLDSARSSGSDAPNGSTDPDDALVQAMGAMPANPESLARDLGMSPREVMTALARLETRGLAARYPDGRYGPC